MGCGMLRPDHWHGDAQTFGMAMLGPSARRRLAHQHSNSCPISTAMLGPSARCLALLGSPPVPAGPHQARVPPPEPVSMAAVYRRVSKVSCSQCELNHSGSSPPWRRSSPGKNGTTETARRSSMSPAPVPCHHRGLRPPQRRDPRRASTRPGTTVRGEGG